MRSPTKRQSLRRNSLGRDSRLSRLGQNTSITKYTVEGWTYRGIHCFQIHGKLFYLQEPWNCNNPASHNHNFIPLIHLQNSKEMHRPGGTYCLELSIILYIWFIHFGSEWSYIYTFQHPASTLCVIHLLDSWDLLCFLFTCFSIYSSIQRTSRLIFNCKIIWATLCKGSAHSRCSRALKKLSFGRQFERNERGP